LDEQGLDDDSEPDSEEEDRIRRQEEEEEEADHADELGAGDIGESCCIHNVLGGWVEKLMATDDPEPGLATRSHGLGNGGAGGSFPRPA
jgi:hypothetical protein